MIAEIKRVVEKRFKMPTTVDYYIDENGEILFEHIIDRICMGVKSIVNNICIHKQVFDCDIIFKEWLRVKYDIEPKSISKIFINKNESEELNGEI